MYLEPISPQFDYSVVITTRNNVDELTMTMNSILKELPSNSQIIIVDGSDEPLTKEWIVDNYKTKEIPIVYTLDNKTGVYDAMNVGLIKSVGNWIVMMTAGDYFVSGAKSLLESIRKLDKDVVVFAQNVVDQSGKLAFSYFPTPVSIWPHQSVILKRIVHEKMGLYPKKYRFVSEQYLFAEVRKEMSYELREEILTVFCLGGITSNTSLSMSKDVFAIRRKLGHSFVTSFVRAFIYPPIRYMLERNRFLLPVSMAIKRAIFPNYRSPTL